MADNYATIQQHQPLRAPAGWDRQEKALIVQLDEIFDDIYRRFGRLRLADMGEKFRKQIADDEGNIAQLTLDLSGLTIEVGNKISKTAQYQTADSIVTAAVSQAATSASQTYIAKTTTLQTADAIVTEATTQAATSASQTYIAKTSTYQDAASIVTAAEGYTDGLLISYSTTSQMNDAIQLYVTNNAYKIQSGIAIDANGIDITGSKYIKIQSGCSLQIKTGGSFTIESGNFSIDSSGNVTINGSGTFSGTLSAASGTFSGKIASGDIEIGPYTAKDNTKKSGLYTNYATFIDNSYGDSVTSGELVNSIYVNDTNKTYEMHFRAVASRYTGTVPATISRFPCLYVTGGDKRAQLGSYAYPFDKAYINAISGDDTLYIRPYENATGYLQIHNNSQYDYGSNNLIVEPDSSTGNPTFHSYMGSTYCKWEHVYCENMHADALKLSRAPTYGELSGR